MPTAENLSPLPPELDQPAPKGRRPLAERGLIVEPEDTAFEIHEAARLKDLRLKELHERREASRAAGRAHVRSVGTGWVEYLDGQSNRVWGRVLRRPASHVELVIQPLGCAKSRVRVDYADVVVPSEQAEQEVLFA